MATQINLIGQAYDNEDGELGGESLRWRAIWQDDSSPLRLTSGEEFSDQGCNVDFTIPSVAIDRRLIIILEATDSNGAARDDQITICIIPELI